ncbi:MAG: hypothetical protein KF730_16065 [Sphingomonas sp.]|uniref:hypothetical protein n=1 Tax=Sphingomonas sp. TaxID=28214 RepID=UPI0025F7A350|nr:hypothetical protein [Sphingomonas sp.]MBX3566076.1 hypothetical protein [Sphingomonas sp.]
MDANPINPAPVDEAMDHMSVAPGPDDTRAAPVISADAGTDQSITDRLYSNPESKEARLDRGLDESMDASDPPASTQPVHSHSSSDLPESSGFNPAKEERLAAGKSEEPGLVERVLNKIGLG